MVCESACSDTNKERLTNLKFSYQKNDNAGCYSGNSVAEIMYNKCKNAEH